MMQLQPDACTSFLHHSDRGTFITTSQHWHSKSPVMFSAMCGVPTPAFSAFWHVLLMSRMWSEFYSIKTKLIQGLTTFAQFSRFPTRATCFHSHHKLFLACCASSPESLRSVSVKVLLRTLGKCIMRSVVANVENLRTKSSWALKSYAEQTVLQNLV